MKTSRSVLILLIILSIIALTDARATSLRCGVRLITEGDYKARVLAECGDNQTRAADRLGLQRSYLNRMIKDLDLRTS